MKPLFLGLTMCFSLCGLLPAGEPAKEEAKKLQGSWNIVSAQMAGMDVPIDKLGVAKLVFKGDKMSYLKADGTAVKVFGFTIDPGKKPKAMDWIVLDQKDARPLPAIYALDGDELKLCFPLLPKKGEKDPPPVVRPDGFDTKDKAAGMFVAKREKS